MLRFAIGALATWRLSHMIIHEDGPVDVLEHFRYIVGVDRDEYNGPAATTNLAKMVMCHWCNSFWIGIFMAVLLGFGKQFFPVSLAFSALTIFVEEAME